MEKLYASAKSIFSTTLFIGLLTLATAAKAQRPTYVSPSNCGVVAQNFNTNNGGFSSPSLYGSRDDRQFFYAYSLGLWNMVDDGAVTAPANAYNVSIISPVYHNPNPVGFMDIGFYYQVPNALADQFQIRVFSVAELPGGFSQTDLIANSDVQFFPNPSAGPDANSGPICLRLTDADITNATPYRIEVTYYIKEGGNSIFDNFSLGSIEAIPLPVTFTGIIANREDNTVAVKWDIAEEKNVKEYQVEKSLNGQTFFKAGTVAAQQHTMYEFTDEDAAISTSFYRIKSVDVDGKFKYSGIVKLNGISNNAILKAYPIPAQSQVTVQHQLITANTLLTLTTLDGRVLKTVRPAMGTTNTFIDLGTLAAGTYIINLHNTDGTVETTKLIKQ